MTEEEKGSYPVETKSFEEQKVELFETFKSTLLKNKEFLKETSPDIFKRDNPFENIRFQTKSGAFAQFMTEGTSPRKGDSEEPDSNDTISTIFLLNQEVQTSSKDNMEFSKELLIEIYKGYSYAYGPHNIYMCFITFVENLPENQKEKRLVYRDSPEALQKAKEFLKQI